MRITVAFNLRTNDLEEQAELLLPADVARICKALKELKHTVTPVEVSGDAKEIIERITDSKPDFIFNVAEGINGDTREAFYPVIYESLNIPFTGSKASLLILSLNKHLTKTLLQAQGINVPKGILITSQNNIIPGDLRYPLIVKPNAEGSSKGITQDSIVNNEDDCKKILYEILEKYPSGVIVEEYITGRELTVPILEEYPGQLLGVAEHTFDLEAMNAKYNIYDFGSKLIENNPNVKTIFPAQINENEYKYIMEMSKKIFKILDCKDFGRIDLRLSEDGIPYFIEINPLPSLLLDASVAEAAKVRKINYKSLINMILKSAIKRYKFEKRIINSYENKIQIIPQRLTLREEGISIGYFKTGPFNAITDVKGVKVGHLTCIKDIAGIPEITKPTCIRTGLTSIIPSSGNIFENPLTAGSFVLNGRGEMAGITQLTEWERLETPILLCNTMSVGQVHDGLIKYMIEKYPTITEEKDVIIPVIGEADDSFLNDVYTKSINISDIKKVINNAKSEHIQQGSVGAGTGMSTFDFAGGIGTSSRILSQNEGGYTIGTLVLSNLGNMRNLTINGKVVGRELVEKYTERKIKHPNSGSIIVVIATDAPMSSSQLNRISKRAALGLGRVGSFAATTSGEIIVSFSTSNRVSRNRLNKISHLNLKFISDNILDLLYEAVIESVEESVINAIFCSSGMKGRDGNCSSAIEHQDIARILKN